MNIKIDFNYAKTETDLKDMKLVFIPGRKNKGERAGSICVKDGMNFNIAEVNTGDLESSNKLAEEIVRRFNDCPQWFKHGKVKKEYDIDNFVEQKYVVAGDEFNHQHVNLIKKDLSLIISLEKSLTDNWYVRDIKFNNTPDEDDIWEIIDMIEQYVRDDKRDMWLHICTSEYITKYILNDLSYTESVKFSDGKILMYAIISKKY